MSYDDDYGYDEYELSDLDRDDMYAEHLSTLVEELENEIKADSYYAEEVQYAENEGLTVCEVIYDRYGITGVLEAAEDWDVVKLQDMFPKWSDEFEGRLEDEAMYSWEDAQVRRAESGYADA